MRKEKPKLSKQDSERESCQASLFWPSKQAGAPFTLGHKGFYPIQSQYGYKELKDFSRWSSFFWFIPEEWNNREIAVSGGGDEVS